MDERVFAEQLREKAVEGNMTPAEMLEWANELDPPLPDPGTVVWWRWTDEENGAAWALGQVHADGCLYKFGHTGPRPWVQIEWKPAFIAKGNEVVVNRDDLVNVLGYYVGSYIITDTKKSAQASLQSLFEALGEAVDDQ